MASFLVDESLPRAVTRALAAAGQDVVDVRDVGLRGSSDDQVFSRAQAEGRVLVSADLDFANALRFPPATHAGIVVTRLSDLASTAAAAILAAAIADLGESLAGAIVIVEPTRVRTFGVRTSEA